LISLRRDSIPARTTTLWLARQLLLWAVGWIVIAGFIAILMKLLKRK
jgi:hypothetical protein